MFAWNAKSATYPNDPKWPTSRHLYPRKGILNNLIDEAHEQENVKGKEKGEKNRSRPPIHVQPLLRHPHIRRSDDHRQNAGQVRGPVQLTFSFHRSCHNLGTQHYPHGGYQRKDASETGDNRTMGRKFTIPYGLYRCHGFISAHFAKQTGFSESDLELFWQALVNMFDHDHSAARGQMNARGLMCSNTVII